MTEDLPIPSDFANAELAALAAALIDGRREARQELGDFTAEELAFTLGPREHSAGAVLLHIARVEAGWILGDLFGMGHEEIFARFPALRREESLSGQWVTLPDTTLVDLYAICDEVRTEILARLATVLSADQPTPSADDWGAHQTARWIVNHLIGHEAYHFGQAVLLVLAARG